MIELQTQSYKPELRLAVELAREAGAAVLDFYEGPLDVEQKYDLDRREPVTQADRLANDLIVQAIRREFPDDGILAEESVDTDRRLRKSRVWMIDPLDGTNGFIDGNGDFAVQIGLAQDGDSVLGVVYQPLTDVLYRAVRGQGTWIERQNEEPVQAFVSDQTEFSLMHLSARTKQWDTCAPQVILREAGGSFTDLFGQSIRYNSPELQHLNGLVATNGAAHVQVIQALAPLLSEFGRVPV